MEEAAWVYVSIIAVLLALGMLYGLFVKNEQRSKEHAFRALFKEVGPHCDYVCRSPLETKLPVTLSIPSGSVIYTSKNKFCGKYEGLTLCAQCDCELAPYTLNLNTSEALNSFNVHSYNCYFERGELNVRVECEG